jgi:hypothetical protein
MLFEYLLHTHHESKVAQIATKTQVAGYVLQNRPCA